MRADAKRNLDRILEAARECFAQGGLEVGVAEIARRAGVGTGTLFRRFPTKEDLVLAVVEERMGAFLELAEAAGSVAEFVEAAVDFQIRDRALFEGLMKSAHQEREELRCRREELIERVGALLERERSTLRPDVEAVDVAVLVHSLAHIAFMTEAATPGLWRRYLPIFLDGLAGATPLGAPAPTLDELDAGVRASSG